jgi:adenosylcobinamide-GDP ribazoletransferase
MTNGVSPSGLSTDLLTGLAFLTRLPVRTHAVEANDLVRASWTFPVIGAGVGAFGAFIYWLAHAFGLHSLICGIFAVAATLVLTGGLHEDGLADTADGFGASAGRERKLAIMHDSQIGTYGAAALIVSLMLRAAAIASLAGPALAASALIAAHSGARAAMLVFMRNVPNARNDGLSAEAGIPTQNSSLTAAAIGTFVLLLCLGFGATLVALLLLAGAGAALATLSVRQIGGQTGDVLGAYEQTAEIAILLVAAAWF